MRKSKRVVLPFLFALCFGFDLSVAHGAVVLYDFETPQEVAACPKIDEPSFSVAVTNAFATGGTNALHFRCRPWTEGQPKWPSFTLPSPVADWSEYDRFVVDVVNCGSANDRLWVYFAEADGKIQRGLQGEYLLSASGYVRWIVPLGKWPKTCDARKIARIHFFTESPKDLNVYIDRLMLLKRGEEPLFSAGPCVLRDLVPLLDARAAKAEREAESAHENARHETSYWRLREACAKAGQDTISMVVGVASSMVKVRPRGEFGAEPATNLVVRLAKGERESVQIVVLAGDMNLGKVSVSVEDLMSKDGALFAATNITCAPVGFVNITNPVPYDVGYVVHTNETAAGYFRRTRTPERGWWPDPILDHVNAVDVNGHDAQSFWLRVGCPRDQKAGVYRGHAIVNAKGTAPVKIPLSIRVNNFAVPKVSPLPLAITFWPGPDYDDPVHAINAKSLLSDPKAPCNVWKNRRMEWIDFLADYYITMDSLYGRGRIQWDALLRLREQGRLGLFNLGYWPYLGQDDGEARNEAKWRQCILDPLRKNYEKAKELGLIAHAYLYGCDELNREHFPKARWAVGELKKEFPGIPVFTTAYDGEYGVGSELDGVDWFTPLTQKYDVEKADAARKHGHKVWWYICCGPHAPYANMYIECPAIEGRLLMGAQSVRMRPDGFLYYEISIWNSRNVLSDGPFTDWAPDSWRAYNGDGSWVCVGPDGIPVATQRLENFRDGLEDYAYAVELERKLNACPDKDSDWARQARKLLEVPSEVMIDMQNFTDSPDAVMRWRDSMADLIESAGK
ncbi:MAG: DUF4091 domain-containing protein [Kiritimatiellae bacterium]|nr:DUF4091 domain-containing protein [Kiritimatiellia bacterium]